jgi:hypothetical protein
MGSRVRELMTSSIAMRVTTLLVEPCYDIGHPFNGREGLIQADGRLSDSRRTYIY